MARRDPVQDWTQASPEELEESIALTRADFTRHLEELKRKFAAGDRLRGTALPAALTAAGLVIGAVALKLALHKRHPVRGKVTRLKVRSMGIGDQVRALRLALSVIRTGKPAVFIVEPGRG